MKKLNGIRVICRITTQEYPWALHFRVSSDGFLKIYKTQYGSALVVHPAGEWKAIEFLDNQQ